MTFYDQLAGIYDILYGNINIEEGHKEVSRACLETTAC